MVLWLCNGSAWQFLIRLSTTWPHLEWRGNLKNTTQNKQLARQKETTVFLINSCSFAFLWHQSAKWRQTSAGRCQQTHTVYSRCDELNFINVGLPLTAVSHIYCHFLHNSTFKSHINHWMLFWKNLLVCFFVFNESIFWLDERILNTRSNYIVFPELSTTFNGLFQWLELIVTENIYLSSLKVIIILLYFQTTNCKVGITRFCLD